MTQVSKDFNHIVEFKYIKPNGNINLGVPENVTVNKGNLRDGGCELEFSTSELSVGIAY